MPAPTVTALRPRGPRRVAVELDGAPWRVVPIEPALRAGLCVGLRLDRERARLLRRELRNAESDAAAVGYLRRRDHTAASLDARLTQRGFDDSQRKDTVDRLRNRGLVDDRRFAMERARRLADRESGDRMIEADLAAQGVSAALRDEALAAIEPESERVAEIVSRRGSGPRTLRRLAARGFSEEALASLIAGLDDGAVP